MASTKQTTADFDIEDGVLVKYNGNGGDVTIPDGVTSIGDYSFGGCSCLTSVSIPFGVINIGNNAFYGCNNLTYVSIPNSVKSIGQCAFIGCSSLTIISLPASIVTMGYGVFNSADKLQDIYCENGINSNRWYFTWIGNWLGDCKATVHWGYDDGAICKQKEKS